MKEHNIYADFSYTLQLGGENKLAFGAKAGATIHDRNLFSDVDPLQPGDPLFSNDVSTVTPNVGLGTFVYGENTNF